MNEKLELLYQQIQEESMIASQTITQLVEKEMQIYHWNIGRILMYVANSPSEFKELSRRIYSLDSTMTMSRLLEFVNLYQIHPDIEDLIL